MICGMLASSDARDAHLLQILGSQLFVCLLSRVPLTSFDDTGELRTDQLVISLQTQHKALARLIGGLLTDEAS